MKIFYIGKFDLFYRTENYVVYALKQAGVDVVKRPYTKTMILSSLCSQIKKHSPDVVLFSKVSSSCFTELIKWCKKAEILTVTWLWDLYWGYRPKKPAQFHTDLLFSTDGGHLDQWNSIKVNHNLLRQGIHKPEHLFIDKPTKHSLAFFGSSSYKQRRQLTSWLRYKYMNRISFHTNIRGKKLNTTMAETKVVIGDSYPTPYYWSNRVYETLGRGGFLLFPETPGLEEEFTSGVHYVSYPRNNFRELHRLITYYLDHDEEREEIRRVGFEKCGEYTYEDRVKVLLTKIEERLEGRLGALSQASST